MGARGVQPHGLTCDFSDAAPFGKVLRVAQATARGCGAAGSASAWHAGGQGFESPQLHRNSQVRGHVRVLEEEQTWPSAIYWTRFSSSLDPRRPSGIVSTHLGWSRHLGGLAHLGLMDTHKHPRRHRAGSHARASSPPIYRSAPDALRPAQQGPRPARLPGGPRATLSSVRGGRLAGADGGRRRSTGIAPGAADEPRAARTAIGTFGEIHVSDLGGRYRARTRFRDTDGRLRQVTATAGRESGRGAAQGAAA